jgi:REP element-mobilizing transposase RayT
VSDPLAYFITFRTFGTWLPGDRRGYVDPEHHGFDTPFAEPAPTVERSARLTSRASPLILSSAMQEAVQSAIRETCSFRAWWLLALNVRTNHVHAVVSASDTPERVMNDLKAYATRRLAKDGLIVRNRPVWSRHGSTRYLWSESDIEAATAYVLHGQ